MKYKSIFYDQDLQKFIGVAYEENIYYGSIDVQITAHIRKNGTYYHMQLERYDRFAIAFNDCKKISTQDESYHRLANEKEKKLIPITFIRLTGV